jgi:hypothetical protein
MNDNLSKDDLTNIIKIYKIFNDNEISMMIETPELISDENIKSSLIKLINKEDNPLSKMKEYFDKYTFFSGGRGRRSRRRKSKKKRSKKKKSKKKRSKRKKSKKKRSKGKKSKKKSIFNWKSDNSSIESDNSSIESDNSSVGNNNSSIENNNNSPIQNNNSSIQRNNSSIQRNNSSIQRNNSSIQRNNSPLGNNNSGSNSGIPNIIINNNNGTQSVEEKTIPQIAIPLKFIINTDDVKKSNKKKGGTNIEINKSDGLDVLKRSLKSGETEFNLTFDFNKNINYENQEFSTFMNTIKDFVKGKAVDVSQNKNVPQFKNELKHKINSINNLLPPFYSQDVVLP